jgi:dolichyl-diphosphooligosaccharide--protein glycosyltransferase
VIVLHSGFGSQRRMIDDFRESFTWLKEQTPPDAKVLSWWDYGVTLCASRVEFSMTEYFLL